MTTTPTQQLLRIPRGLWADLEETVIQQDRQFLAEVARSLGLPVQEVLRRCLGTGAPTSLPTLWASPHLDTETDLCPWWECHGDGLWRRCPRLRLAPSMPCQVHERCTPCPMARLQSDPVIRALPWRVPVIWEEKLYWVDPSGSAPPFREDGTLVSEGTFRRISVEGEAAWAWVPC